MVYYRILANGLIIQWIVLTTTSTTASNGVTLPLPYSNSNYAVSLSGNHFESNYGYLYESLKVDSQHVKIRTRSSHGTQDGSSNAGERECSLITRGY